MKKQELNKKLAEWVGLHPRERSDGHTIQRIDQPNFTESLDACFKWLVPKVIKDAEFSVIITQNLAQSVGYIRPMQFGKQYDAIDNYNPALALCLAIEKLIDKES